MVQQETRDEVEQVINFCMTALLEIVRDRDLHEHPVDFTFVVGVIGFLEHLRDQRLDQIAEAAEALPLSQ